MSVPDRRDVPQKLFATGLFDLKTHDGQGAFTDACVSALHGLDPNWGHLIKKPGQTDVHDHGEDSALYKQPNNAAQAVDFIGGAGGPNPQPGWIVDTFPYTHADWFDPTDHGITESPSQPAPIISRDEFYARFKELDDYYAAPEGLQRTNPRGMALVTPQGVPYSDREAMGAWGYDLMTGRSVSECKQAIRHSEEWRLKHPGEQP